jgi:hypothetical protein
MGRTSPFRGEGGKVWNRDAKAASGPAAACHPFSSPTPPPKPVTQRVREGHGPRRAGRAAVAVPRSEKTGPAGRDGGALASDSMDDDLS